MSMKGKKGIVPFAAIGLVIVGVALIVALMQANTPLTEHPLFVPDTTLNEKVIPHFSSEQEIFAAFTQAQQNNGGNPFAMRDNVMAPMAAVMEKTASADSGAAGGAGSAPATGPSYSNTNVQVQGVDEADIVKTDGKYIYAFYKNKLVITLAYPANEARVVKILNLDTINPQEMFVNGDQLVLFGTSYQQGPNIYANEKMAVNPGFGGSYIYPPYWNSSKFIVNVYDISDKENPKVDKELSFVGNYVSSRMIGNHVYFVQQTYPDYQLLNAATKDDTKSIIPPYTEDGVEKPLAVAKDIGYFRPINAQSFVTIGSLNLDSLKFDKETIVGSAETVFSSEKNLYIAHTQWNYSGYPYPIPLMARVEGDSATPADGTTTTDTTMPVKENTNVTQTIIDKFSLNEGKIDYEGQGKVAGHVLNQFSLDEFEGNLRVATTVDGIFDESNNISTSTNNVYVLNDDMKTVGSLEDLAPGEKIYSARFMGERAYLVTFKQIDPLFVLDLSDAKSPKVLGKLKIPGYSDYLHPIDATHLIGIGKETQNAPIGDNFVIPQGMKVAIFDVSNVEHPTQLHSLGIGDMGTDSYALQDHKAFLYDSEKQLMVLPIYLYEIPDADKKNIDSKNFWNYGVPTFQGAFVYHVTLTDGFDEVARITHVDEDVDLKSGYYYDDRYLVKRSLFIDDVLYTVSSKMIKATSANDWKEIKSIPFFPTQDSFTITARVEGSFCAGPCGYQEIEINKVKIKQTNFTGGTPGYTNYYENPAYGQYDDLVENLDWSAFKSLDNTLGCPGCADGSVETITISDGKTTKTIRMEAGMEVKEIQPFLNAINNYVGLGGIYYGRGYADGGMGIATPEIVDAPPQVVN